LVYCLGSLGVIPVTRKNLAAVVLVVAVFSLASALVAYRMGLKRGHDAQSTFSSAGRASAADSGCVDFRDAARIAGQSGCVAGRVLRVYISRSGSTFLDFCSDYRNCPFTSVIFSSDKGKFGNLQSLAGQRIEIHGEITSYQGKPEIILRDPGQIRKAE
jgi:hypothetical protein